MLSIANYWLFKYMYRFKGTTGTEVKNLLLFKQGVMLLFRPPGVPLDDQKRRFSEDSMINHLNLLTKNPRDTVLVSFHWLTCPSLTHP